jgi:uncharacterized protein YbjT (DUF2867 family)
MNMLAVRVSIGCIFSSIDLKPGWFTTKFFLTPIGICTFGKSTKTMKAIIFGATGMIGKGVLLECLDHAEVAEVLSIGRSRIELSHAKLRQIEHRDFLDFSAIASELQGYDACFFCLGISAAGMQEAEYKRITYDFAMTAAHTLVKINPEMTFTYVSGQGTDSTEKGRMMWARIKGKLENDLLALGFQNPVMFRPGAIIPRRGIKSRTRSYQFMYDYFGWLLKAIEKVSPNSVTDTTKIGLAMINAHLIGVEKRILSPRDINLLAAK